MRQVFEVGVAAKSLDRPWFEAMPYDAWLVGRRTVDDEEREVLLGSFGADGSCRGTLLAFIPTGDNLDKLYVDLDVDPAVRRHGVGRELIGAATELGRQHRRSCLMVDAYVPVEGDRPHPYDAFAAAVGFRPGWIEATRHLPLPVAQRRLDHLGAQAAAAYSPGYRIETYAGGVPEALLPDLAQLMSLLAVDSPSGEIDFEPEQVTPERLRHNYEREERQGCIRLSALAIHETSWAVVAQSDIILPPGETVSASQIGTYVHRDHRGHRLGLAVKVANLQYLQRNYPGRRFVRTCNADDNSYMVAINVTLGYELVERLVTWVRDI